MTQPQPVMGMWTREMTLPPVFMVPDAARIQLWGEPGRDSPVWSSRHPCKPILQQPAPSLSPFKPL